MKIINEKLEELLANEISVYINSRRDKKEEEFLKSKPKKNKQSGIIKGGGNTRLASIVKRLSEDKESLSKIEKSKKSKEQAPLDFHRDKFNCLLLLLEEDSFDNDLIDLKSEYQEFLLNNGKEHNAVVWLTKWTPKAKDISFATHVGKLTHSSSKSTSILDATKEKNDCYLTTNSVSNIEVDTASSNAASLPIADILKLEVEGISVLDCLKRGEYGLFRKLTDDEALVDEWRDQLKQSYDSTQKQSYFLSKQVYFPTKGKQYQLLLPLTSSSLVHELHMEHKKIWDGKKELDIEQRIANEQKKNKKYSATITRTYQNKAYLHVTGSKHINASSLNGKRDGRISLLPTMPPQWKSNFKFNANKSSLFDKILGFELKNEVDDLKKYLLVIKSKSLSISEPKRNAAVINKLKAISSRFFDYIELVNNSISNANWSGEANLPIEQQLLFEPWRMDEAATETKKNRQWENTLSKSYGRWLSKQLQKKNKLLLTSIHETLWADVFSIELREFITMQEVAV